VPGTNALLRVVSVRHTTTFRLTLAYGAVFVIAVAGLLGLIYVRTVQDLTGRNDQILFNEAHQLLSTPPSRLQSNLSAALNNNTSRLNYFGISTQNRRLIAGDLPLPQHFVINHPFEPKDSDYLLVPKRLLVLQLNSGNFLVIGRDISQINDFRKSIFSILLVSGLFTVALALGAGIVLSIEPLRRAQRITSVARRIALGELQLRIPISSRQDELDLIAAAINTMVDDIESLMTQVKSATDAIAHDLRSPLAQVRAKLELLQRPNSVLGTPDQIDDIISAAVGDLDQVLSRFNALLRIAELEASNRRAAFSVIDPMALIASVCELFEPWAQDRGISLSISGSYGQTIEGDEKLLFEALSNLVENAIKFIPSNGHVNLSVTSENEYVVLEVRDDGSGIPANELEAVLRRFHRGTTARQTTGSGLGLSLVASIMRLHDFDLRLLQGGPGLIVQIRCPRFEMNIGK